MIEELRSEILDQKLPIGTRLPSELELAERFGLGRVTIREALRALEHEGLVDIRRGPNGGNFVHHADIAQVSSALALLFNFRGTTLGEFAEFRLLVEPRVAYLAARHASADQRQELDEIGSGDFDSTRSTEVHDLIAESCGNDVLEFIVKAMSDSLNRHFRTELISQSDNESTAQAHSKIARLISAGDCAGAQRAMEVHLQSYRDYLIEQKLDGETIIRRGRDGSDRLHV